MKPDFPVTTNLRTISRLFRTLAVMLLFLVPAGCFFPGAIDDIDVKQLESVMKNEKKLVIVDNRTEVEYASGRIPGSMHISPENIPVIASLLPADKDTPLIFYCSGMS